MVRSRRPPEPRSAVRRPRPYGLVAGQLDFRDVSVVLALGQGVPCRVRHAGAGSVSERHVLAFEHFGGVPGRVRYDNLKTAVVSSLAAMMVWGAVPDVHPLVASTVVDLLDTVTGCILAGLGVSPAESRVILDALLVHDPSAN
jgi:hypothetical protein